MRYMLDTNIIACARNNRPESVLKRLMQHRPEDVCISAITLAELEYGVFNSARPGQNQLALMTFLAGITVMPFDAEAAGTYGVIRADLKRKGTPIGANALLIAAHARALNLTLVTNNTREFERVEGLKLEDWTQETLGVR